MITAVSIILYGGSLFLAAGLGKVVDEGKKTKDLTPIVVGLILILALFLLAAALQIFGALR